MSTILRLTGQQHSVLHKHLFPGDGFEAAAVLLCGRRAGERHALCVHKVFPVPYEECQRAPDYVKWQVESILPLLEEAARKNLAVMKVHSHPGGLDEFSWVDDRADRELFPGVYAFLDDGQPNGSAIMLPDGRMFGRVVTPTGMFEPLEQIVVAGGNIHIWKHGPENGEASEASLRLVQAFGEGTTRLLSQLSVAVVGVSGTGAPVVEQLARCGVRELVLVDPDVVEEKNLNRINNAFFADAEARTLKVDVQARAIEAMGFGNRVVPIAKNLMDPEVVRRVAECDVVIGCMDSVDGRHVLNKLASTYVLPYIDVGVRLDADGQGGVDGVMFAVHYLQPDGSSLLSRGVYTLEEYRAAALHRENPREFARQREQGYIRGVDVDRPAVISVNMTAAGMAVLELLARLHPYRIDANNDSAAVRFSHVHMGLFSEVEGFPCSVMGRIVGRGDMTPLLDLPSLSDVQE